MHASSRCLILAAALLAISIPAVAQNTAYPSETPAHFKPTTTGFDYERRDVMIPMRDGVKLHTVILVPKGARNAPILLTRTPYDANELTAHAQSSHLGPILQGYDNAVDVIVEGGYIRVVQDIRGKYGSEGDYVMNRPLHGPQNPTPVDESTDTYDTIDWLVKNIPESNGKVGILGISYDGFLPLMALVHPHPALKVAVPDESHGRRLDGRRLVPQRRLPPAEHRRTSTSRSATRSNTHQLVDKQLRRLRYVDARRLRRRARQTTRHGADRLLEQGRRASRV